MGSLALRKVVRDVWLARGRAALIIVAAALSVTALGSVAGAYGIIAREMPRSFLSTNPASATVVLQQPIDEQTLRRTQQQSGVADAQARALVSMRVEVSPDRWLPLSVFAVENFTDMRIETVDPLTGAWPPPTGTLLVERTAVPVLQTGPGATLHVQTPDGDEQQVVVSGIVSDPALAPAWQEQRGYAYASVDTLEALGVHTGLDQLKVLVADNRFDSAHIAAIAQDVAQTLNQNGVTVEEIRIPPPGEHPHQRLMETLVTVLLGFALFLFVLSGIVMATLVTGMLSRQVRQIGAMKAIGAERGQIAAMYATLVLVIGALSLVLSLPLSTIGARGLASVFAELSNITLENETIPGFVYVSIAVAGLALPLLAAALPIARASAMTVREAISDVGLYSVGATSATATMPRLARWVGPTMVLALRNALRRRGRLVLSAGLLAVGGALFMAGLNVAEAGDARMTVLEATRGYDIDVTLNRAAPTEMVLDIARGVPGVEYVEPLDFITVSPVQPGAMPISTTHKDGGHGSMPLWVQVPNTRYPSRLLAGRALEPENTDALVAGRGTLIALGAQVGDKVWLAIDGKPTRWQIVGVVEGFGVTADNGLFTTEGAFAQATGQSGVIHGMRIATRAHDQAARSATLSQLGTALQGSGLSIASDMQADWINTVLRNHIAIVQGAFQILGLLVGVVGAFTLGSAIGISVIERSREFGVMLTLGAGTARVVAIVIAEGVVVAVLSWIAAVVLTVLLSYLAGVFVGAFLFDAPLPLVISPVTAAAWLGIALVASVLAGALPAASAARMTIRESLAYT